MSRVNAKSYVIAIDSGTQSVRAVLFDRHGSEIALEPMYRRIAQITGYPAED